MCMWIGYAHADRLLRYGFAVVKFTTRWILLLTLLRRRAMAVLTMVAVLEEVIVEETM